MPRTATHSRTHVLSLATSDIPRSGQEIAGGAFPPDRFPGGLATAASPRATGATGVVGTSTLAAREDHKHAAQGVSADAGNLLSAGTDGLHKLVIATLISADAGNQLSAGTDGKLLVPAA